MAERKQKVTQEKQQDNMVVLIGKITSIRTTGKSTIVRVRIPRRGRRGDPKFAVPKVYFFAEDQTDIENFLKDDNVKISGHLVNTRKRRPNGTYFYSQAVIGDKIEKNASLFKTEMGLEEDFDMVAAQPVSLVYLHGPVENISQAGNRAYNIRMNARQNGRDNHVSVIDYDKDALLLMPGDEITVHGMIDTRVDDRGEIPKFYQNVIVQKLENHTRQTK